MTYRVLVAFLGMVLAACATSIPDTGFQKNSPLTHGNVQMTLKVGETTQEEVLEVFGAPNITTIDDSGNEVWTYQKHATVTRSKSRKNAWSIIFAGGGTQASGFEESSRTITLIIKFDKNKVVSSFRSRASSF